jgi:hypothetical protein
MHSRAREANGAIGAEKIPEFSTPENFAFYNNCESAYTRRKAIKKAQPLPWLGFVVFVK